MAETIETKIISIKDAKNGNFDIALKNFPQAQPQQGVVQLRANVIQIRNAKNGNFDLVIPEDHTLEDALITGEPLDEYYNDRITFVNFYAFCASGARVIRLPNVTQIYAGAFNSLGGNAKQEIYLPRLTNAGGSCFVRNTALKICDVGSIPFVNAQFNQCTVFDTLILRRTSSLVEPNSTAFSQCPFAPDGDGGYVYVPQALLSQYQASNAWATYANVLEFRAIEGSEYEIIE